MIAGWDGEEYGLFGSTEFAEQERADLVKNAVAYANLDGAGGASFDASGVPQLDDSLVGVAQSVIDPHTGGSVYDTWRGDDDAPQVGRLGSGSDYTAFLYLGQLIEYGRTDKLFINPMKKQTEDYITGRFG